MRLFVSHEMEIYVVQSYSKNLGLCTKWIGFINVVLSSLDVLTRVKRQLKMIVNLMYSNPLIHRIWIVKNVVIDSNLFDELMSIKIKGVWYKLYNNISTKYNDCLLISNIVPCFSMLALTKIRVIIWWISGMSTW